MHPHVYNLIRNRYLRAPADGAAGGQPTATQAPAQTTQQPAQTQPPGNNTSGIDLGDTFWQSPGNNTPQQTQAPLTAEQQQQNFDNYIKGLNFKPQISQEAAQKIQQGDMTPLQDMFDALGKAIYKQSILDGTRISNDVGRRERGNAVRETTGILDGREITQLLEQQVPAATDPVLSPVARAVMQQAMQKGQKPAEAIKTVQKYFQRIKERSHEDFGLPKPAKTARAFPGPGDFEESVPEIDWLAFATNGSTNPVTE